MNSPDLHLGRLARRAVDAPRFEWATGMRYLTEGRAYRLSDDDFFGKIILPPDHLPDLSDPATLGALLAIVREAWGSTFHIIPQGGWLAQGARLPNGATVNLGICEPSEAAALVAALEAASLPPAP